MRNELILERRRAPDSSRPFVNRKEELDLVQAKLEAGVQGGRIRSGIICFWGAFGLGKSWLLLNLERLNKGKNKPGMGSHPTVTTRLDLDYVNGRVFWQGEGRRRLDRDLLIREMWKQLAEQMQAEPPAPTQSSPDALAEAFVAQVTQWAATAVTPLIMLDTIDNVYDRDQESFVWFEEKVLARLAVTGRVLFCLTSRGELWHWERFQVRRRITSYRLQAFDLAASAQQIRAGTAISQALYNEAFGHPLVTDYLCTALERSRVDLQSDELPPDLFDPAMIVPALECVVRELLEVLPNEETKTLARHVCVLRWLAVDPLRVVAEQLGIVRPGRGDQYYLNLLNRLHEHNLVYWNSTTNAYEFDPVLRKLLDRSLELRNLEKFRKAHDAAYVFYREHLRERPIYLDQYVTELAYHRSVLDRCEPDAPRMSLSEWWDAFLAKGEPRAREPWLDLVQSLAEDTELESELPPTTYERLYRTAQERTKSSPDES
jgi:hypothetical protein